MLFVDSRYNFLEHPFFCLVLHHLDVRINVFFHFFLFFCFIDFLPKLGFHRDVDLRLGVDCKVEHIVVEDVFEICVALDFEIIGCVPVIGGDLIGPWNELAY